MFYAAVPPPPPQGAVVCLAPDWLFGGCHLVYMSYNPRRAVPPVKCIVSRILVHFIFVCTCDFDSDVLPFLGIQPMGGRTFFSSNFLYRTPEPHSTPTCHPLPFPVVPLRPTGNGFDNDNDNDSQSFLFYWLLAPNVTSFRRNRALRGRIAPFPGAEGNSVAIFRARVASATEEVRMCGGWCLC